MEKMFNQLLQQMKELTEQLQKQSIQLQQQNEQLTELQENIEAKDAQIAALECVSKMPEVHLAGNYVAVTAPLPAFLR